MLGGPGPRLIARPSCAASAIQIALGWTGVHRSRERTSPSAGPQDQDYWAPGRSPAIAATRRSRSSPARCRRQTRSSARSAATTRPRATSSRWRPRRDQLESRCASTSPGCHPRCSMVWRGVPPRRGVSGRHGSGLVPGSAARNLAKLIDEPQSTRAWRRGGTWRREHRSHRRGSRWRRRSRPVGEHLDRESTRP